MYSKNIVSIDDLGVYLILVVDAVLCVLLLSIASIDYMVISLWYCLCIFDSSF